MDRQVRKNTIAVAALAAGFVLATLGLFTAWWTVDGTGAAEGSELWLFKFRARPFTTSVEYNPLFGGTAADADLQLSEALDRPALVVGLFAALGVFLLGAVLVLAFLGRINFAIPSYLHLFPLATCAGVGAVAVALAPLQWPEEWDRHLGSHVPGDNPVTWEASWTGSDRPEPEFEISYSPSWGWFLTILGLVGMPGLAISTRWWPVEAKHVEPKRDFEAFVEAPPPLPIMEAYQNRPRNQPLRPQPVTPPRTSEEQKGRK